MLCYGSFSFVLSDFHIVLSVDFPAPMVSHRQNLANRIYK